MKSEKIFLEKLYLDIDKEKRLTFSPEQKGKKTNAFYSFNSNLGIALVLPTLIYGPGSDDDWAARDAPALQRLAINQIITSLETYYHDIFEIIAKEIKITELNLVALVDFIKKYGFANKFLNTVKQEKHFNFGLLKVMPQKFSIQSGEKIRNFMNLIDLDPIGPFKKEWERTFGNNKNSTIVLRHSFIHRGIWSSHLLLPKFDFTKKRIKDGMVLVSYLENQVIKKYSFEELYPQRVK